MVTTAMGVLLLYGDAGVRTPLRIRHATDEDAPAATPVGFQLVAHRRVPARPDAHARPHPADRDRESAPTGGRPAGEVGRRGLRTCEVNP